MEWLIELRRGVHGWYLTGAAHEDEAKMLRAPNIPAFVLNHLSANSDYRIYRDIEPFIKREMKLVYRGKNHIVGLIQIPQ